MSKVMIKNFKQLSSADAKIAGGKGASLGEMTRSGISVPPGFVITANAFDRFFEKTGLNKEIEDILDVIDIKNINNVKNAFNKIKTIILSKNIPKDIETEILNAYKELNCKYVAVRSSATEEDSLGASWAGILETYLNTSEDDLIINVKKCWLSLFAPRAIIYRAERGLLKTKINVAVVVQKMIESEKSGICFSAHPVTKDRSKIIIEAGFGLGEAIVSGAIVPDTYIVDKTDFSILDINVGNQIKALYRRENGGNRWKKLGEEGKKQVLSKREIIELSKLILKIEKHYGFPCDVEWAKEKNIFYIVQSRPITTLTKENADKDKRTNIKDRIIAPDNLSVFEISKYDNYFSVVARKSVLLLRCCLPWGYCDSERYIKLFGFPSPYKPFYDSWRGIFVDKNAVMKEKEEILTRVKKDPNYLKLIADKLEKDGDSFWEKSFKIKEMDLKRKSDEELQKLVCEKLEEIINLSTYLLFPISLQGYLEDSIKTQIAKKVKDKKLKDEYFNILTTPSKQNFGYFEQKAILKLAVLYNKKKSVKSIEQDIKEYLFKFNILGVKLGVGELWGREEVVKRIKYLAEQSPQEKLNHLLAIPQQNDDKVKAVLKKLNTDENFSKFIEIARRYVYLRTYRTDVISGIFANMFPLFEEIGRRNKIDLKSVIECLPNEVIDFKFPDEKEIQKRAQANIIRGIDGNLYIAFGRDAIKIRKKLLANVNAVKNNISKRNITKNIKDKEVKGVVVNRGVVRGRVKIVLDNTELKKVKRGDILVSPMTTPDFVPAMEKAAAFVTDEGGILCHAAIVSREMQKPCIVGTGNATSILKDGDLVEVNTDKGVVEIIERKK